MNFYSKKSSNINGCITFKQKCQVSMYCVENNKCCASRWLERWSIDEYLFTTFVKKYFYHGARLGNQFVHNILHTNNTMELTNKRSKLSRHRALRKLISRVWRREGGYNVSGPHTCMNSRFVKISGNIKRSKDMCT